MHVNMKSRTHRKEVMKDGGMMGQRMVGMMGQRRVGMMGQRTVGMMG